MACGKLPIIGSNGLIWEVYLDKECKSVSARGTVQFVFDKICTVPGPGGSLLIHRESKEIGMMEEYSTIDCKGISRKKYKLELNKCSKGIGNLYFKMIQQ